jgi:hypothetical protein
MVTGYVSARRSLDDNIAAKCADTLAERCLSDGVHKIGSDTVALIAAVIQYTVG